MRLGIVIPHLHVNEKHRWLLYNLLDSFERHEPGLLKSIVVCDDASPMTDAELKTVLSPYPVTGIRRKENTTYSANVNMGLSFLRKHGCELALILNNDVTLLQPISPLVKYFKEIKDLAVVGIRLWYPDGRLQHGGIGVNAAKEIHHPDYRTWNLGLGTRFTHVVTGAFQMVALSQIGMYPIEYRLGYEDVAFCLRLWQRGKRVLYTNSVGALHSESATRGFILGRKEHQSVSAFHLERFQFPAIEQNRLQAQECYPHELLSSLLCPQPIPPYARDFRKLDLAHIDRSIRRAPWALARKHLKLKPVGLDPKDRK